MKTPPVQAGGVFFMPDDTTYLPTPIGERDMTEDTKSICPMMAEPQAEHRWLERLVGEWTSEAECMMEPPETFRGTEIVRSLGGLWVLAEGHGDLPGGGAMTTVLTLGYDPAKQRYVGSFIGSMMTHMWLYQGRVDGNILALETEGPDFTTDGKTMARYVDSIEWIDDDNRVMRSRMQGRDGTWHDVMIARYRRKAS